MQFRLMCLSREKRQAERGAALVLLVVFLFAALVMAGFVIDVGRLLVVRTQLQATADAAALAGASQLPDEGAVEDLAFEYAALNYPDPAIIDASDVVLGYWGSATPFVPEGSEAFPEDEEPNAVLVVVRREQARGNAVPLFFGAFLGSSSSTVSASAIAVYPHPQSACIWALDPHESEAFLVESNADLVADCGIQVNSDASDALVVTSNAELQATSIDVVGSYEVGFTSGIEPDPHTGAAPETDPLAHVPPPDASGACTRPGIIIDQLYNMTVEDPAIIEPGIYCGPIQIQMNAAAIFQPGTYIVDGGIHIQSNAEVPQLGSGTYIIRGGGFTVGSNAVVHGEHVGIYNTCTTGSCAGGGTGYAGIVLDSNANVRLTAPSDGTPLDGILFFQDRDADPSVSNTIASNADGHFNGAIYFPTQHLEFASNAAGSETDQVILIARTISISSNANIDFGSLPSNVPEGMSDLPVALVD